MSDDQKYNGWTNHATWAANLWLDGSDLDSFGFDPSRYDSEPDDRLMTSYLADAIKEYIDEFDPLADKCDMYSDLLSAAIRSINFYELAEHYVADYRYDNPRKTSDSYLIDFTGNVADTEPYWYESNDPDQIFCGTSVTFWEAFNACIEEAIDCGWSSIVIEWQLDPSDLTSKGEKIVADTAMRNQADALIRKQATRSEKHESTWFKVRVFGHGFKGIGERWEVLSNKGNQYDVPNQDVDNMGLFNSFYEAISIACFTAVKQGFASLLLIPSEYK